MKVGSAHLAAVHCTEVVTLLFKLESRPFLGALASPVVVPPEVVVVFLEETALFIFPKMPVLGWVEEVDEEEVVDDFEELTAPLILLKIPVFEELEDELLLPPIPKMASAQEVNRNKLRNKRIII